MQTPTDLNTPILEGGLERIPFFNGRVLTAEDLNTEQAANAQERCRLGRALGTGVVEGLFVRKTSDATVTVEAGLGLAPSGLMVELPQRTEVSVISNVEREETAGTKGAFEDCALQSATITTGAGAYLLLAEPASKPRGRTPRTSLGGDGAAGECGAERRVEGAKLRLVHLDMSDNALVPSSLADGGAYDVRKLSEEIVTAREKNEEPRSEHVSKLRNVLAHVCLRTPSALTDAASLYDTLRRQARGQMPDPIGSDGPLDVLRKRARERENVDELGDAVPIGLLYWSGNRIEFVDVWSVRRRVHRPDPQCPAPVTARRRAETEAALLQFQAHLADLRAALSAGERQLVRARDYLKWIPPVGLLPEQAGTSAGFRRETFFEGLSTRKVVVIEGARAQTLVDSALQYLSIPTRSKQLVWRYEVRENRQAVGRGEAEPYVLFSTGYQPFYGAPQYNLSRWSHGNYHLDLDPR